ncbi:MAG TPA: hypothetical protein VMN56_10795 [Casimicrobiaceae bacterium]|nr:hypothetical protein [Casimicrobiaceae bacterium]
MSSLNAKARCRARLAGVIGLLLATALPAGAAVTTVYKCFDRNLGVLYTDQPCRGEQLSIESGSVDPVGIAELQREREALSRSMAARTAATKRNAAVDRDVALGYDVGYGYPAPQGDDVYYPAYFGGWGSAPNTKDRRPPQDSRKDKQPYHVPVPPPTHLHR